MIRRHPHVFGETVTASDGQPLKEWGQIKAWEKQQMTYQEDPRRKNGGKNWCGYLTGSSACKIFGNG